MKSIPLWLKLGATAFMVIWVPTIYQAHGLENYLWFCDVANFVLLLGLWMESPLLISSQAVGVLLVQLFWTVDFLGRLAIGFHPLGATTYMFDAERPLFLRGLSLYHLVVPIVLIWAIRRVGYHRRGYLVQTVLSWIVLPLSFLLTNPERNINWLWRPFGVEQIWMEPATYFWLCMALYPLVLYWPTHQMLMIWARRSRSVSLLS